MDLVRDSNIARALRDLPTGSSAWSARITRGVGRSDKPHEAKAYAMGLHVADAVAVLDELGLERAHFVGASWGEQARLRDRTRARRVLSASWSADSSLPIEPRGTARGRRYRDRHGRRR